MNVPSSRSCVGQLAVARAADERRRGPPRSPRASAARRSGSPARRAPAARRRRCRRSPSGTQQRVLGVLDVDVAVAHQRVRADLREQVGDGDADVRVELAHARDELVRARHVGADRRAGRPAPPTPRSAGARSSCGSSSAGPTRPRRPGRCAAAGAGAACAALDVLGDDPALGPGAAAAAEVDPALPRDPPRERRGLDPAAVRGALAGCGRGCLGTCAAAGAARGRARPLAALGAGVASADRTSSPASPIRRSSGRPAPRPTAARSSAARRRSSASTSWVTLSVSTSKSGSPFSTVLALAPSAT